MKSIINWQTGTPTEFGLYLVVLEDDNKAKSVSTQHYVPESYHEQFPQMMAGWTGVNFTDFTKSFRVVAWYKVRDVKVFDNHEMTDDEIKELSDTFPRKHLLSTAQLKTVWTDGFTNGFKSAVGTQNKN